LIQACLVLGILLVGLTGCGQPPKKKQFNNMIARANNELKEKATAFRKAIEPLSTGGQVTGAQARGALNAVESTFNEIKTKFDKMKPPVNSPRGQDLLDKYRAFLKTQENIIDSCFKPIVSAIERGERDWNYINGRLKAAEALEGGAYKDLTNAQSEYAKAHNFTPTAK